MIVRPQAIRDSVIIGLSFLLGFVLTILPLPSWAIWYRPAWVLLILIFWLLAIPHRLGIAVAWVVGLLMDLLTGTELGLHALFFTLLAYLILKFHLALRGVSSGQKFILVLVAQFAYVLVHYWVTNYSYRSSLLWWNWLPVLTTMVCWPWVSMLLRDFQRRFEIR